MIYAVSLLGTILNATSGLSIAGIIAFILGKGGLAHRKYLWLGLVYSGLQGFTAATVSVGLYSQRFTLLAAVLRLCFGLTGQGLTVALALQAVDLVRVLRETRDAEVRLEDDRGERLQATGNLVDIGTHLVTKQERQYSLLRQQGAR